MLKNENVAPEERGRLVRKWRTTLGWSVGDAAIRMGVTTRTVSAIESETQIMPASRWRLFVHEVLAEINRVPAKDLVVILSEDQAPLDVVSRESYAGYAVDDDGVLGLIASASVNRVSGSPQLHRQRFLGKENLHVIRAARRWEEARPAVLSDSAAFGMHRWLMGQVLQGELQNPRLTKLKLDVNDAKAALDLSIDATDETRERLMRQLDEAIRALMEAVSTGREPMARQP